MNAEARALAASQPSQWIANPRWDLVVLTLSAALVAVPPLVHSFGKTTAGGVDLLITLLIGGPHMYATFLKTVFDPRFRQIHPALTWAPVVVDPSHSVGKSTYVEACSLAAIAYGADGLCIETHVAPSKGIGDDPRQAVTPDVLHRIITRARSLWDLTHASPA